MVVAEGLDNFLACIHDEGAVGDDRLVDRFTGEHQNARSRIGVELNRAIVVAIEDTEVTRWYGLAVGPGRYVAFERKYQRGPSFASWSNTSTR